LKRIALHVCSFAVIMTIVWLMTHHAARRRAPKSGQFHFSMPAKLFVSAVLALLPLPILDPATEPELRLGLIALEIVCFGFALDVFTTRITLTNDYVEKSSLFGKRRILFPDISDIKRQDSSQSYVIRAAPNVVLKLSLYIDGIESLIRTIRERAINVVARNPA
jgi:hypothetical protein